MSKSETLQQHRAGVTTIAPCVGRDRRPCAIEANITTGGQATLCRPSGHLPLDALKTGVTRQAEPVRLLLQK